MGGKGIEPSQVSSLLLGLESRGRDSAGVVLQNADEEDLLIHKAPVSANTLINSKEYNEFLKAHLSNKTKIALVHTRLHTVGHWSKNENNHPLSRGITAVVHNGSVSNYKALFTQMSLEPGCETDSDIIRAIADRDGLEHKTVRELEKCSGSIAAAILDKRAPGKLLLLKSGNPIEMTTSDDFIVFASTRKPADVAMRHYKLRHGLWEYVPPVGVGRPIFPADTAWLMSTTEGKIWHQEFKTAPYTWVPYHGGGYGTCDRLADPDYSFFGMGRKARRKRLKQLLASGEAEIKYICPKCGDTLDVPKDLRHKHKSDLNCTGCKTSLKNAREIIKYNAN